jgi:SAM-dependent methyltransferase
MITSSDLQRTSDHWNTEGAWQMGRGIHWLELPAVPRRLNEKVSGHPDVDWIAHSIIQYLSGRLPLERCLSQGCGEGALERRLASEGAFLACDAVDIAPGSISKARAKAKEAGLDQISYEVAYANYLSLPVKHYDAVWCHGAVHHFERLEHVFEQVAAAVRPDGVSFLDEYAGPGRFQFPQRQCEVIQACHDLLPTRCRDLTRSALDRPQAEAARGGWCWLARRLVDTARDGDLLNAIGRHLRRMSAVRGTSQLIKKGPDLPTERSVRAVDPSEAGLPAEIVPVLRRTFRIIEGKELGGNILRFLLADIAGNFQDSEGEQLLQLLFDIEDELMHNGDLASDFVYIVSAPQPSQPGGQGLTR